MSLIRGHPCLGWGLKAARMQGSATELSNQNQSAVVGSHSREGWKTGQNSVSCLNFICLGYFSMDPGRVWEAEAGLVCGTSSLRPCASSRLPPSLMAGLLMGTTCLQRPTAETWSVPTEPIVIEMEWASIEAVIWVWYFTCALSSVHDNLVRYEWLVLYWRWD